MAQGTGIAAPADLWHARDAASVIGSLGLAPDIGMTGLTDTDAAARLARSGPNTLPPPEPRPGWRIFLRQFASPLIVILLIAAVITGLQRHWIDTAAILGVVGIAIALGFWQERRGP